MEELFIAQVDYGEARLAADLASHFQDLAFTINALDRLQKLVDDNVEDATVTGSLWVAAVISYARCFSSGKRFGLSNTLFSNIEGGVECHQLYMNLRNKHIAHSVNPFEQVVVGLVLSPPASSDRKVEGISILSQKLIHFDTEGIQNLRRLTLIAMKHIETQGKAASTNALEVGMKLPLDELYTRATPRTVAPPHTEAGRARHS